MKMSARRILSDLGYGSSNLDDAVSMEVVDWYLDRIYKLKTVRGIKVSR